MNEPRTSGNGIEECRGIGSIVLAAGEVADVGINACSCLIVIPRCQVHVAHHVSRLTPHDEANFGMGFKAAHSVNDLRSRIQEFLGTL